jgi:uncharacterized protein (TIGR00369 family)
VSGSLHLELVMDTERDSVLKWFRKEYGELPFHRFLGLSQESFDIENGCIRFDMKDELVGNKDFNILHGGVIGSILDLLGMFILTLNGAWRSRTASVMSPLKVKGGTIDLHIDYLRPGKGKHFVASGTILRQGNKVAVVRSELRNEQNELIAVGTGTYLFG